MLTAKSSESDVAKGLNIGADDFLSKPFSFIVLMARLRALLRRGRKPYFEDLAAGLLHYNATNRQCFFDGQAVKLTGREAMVLEVLLRSGGQVVPKQTLLRQVWGMDFDGDPNIVDVYVSYLRRKIDHAYDQQLLHTVRGIGYRHSGQSPLPFKFLENGPLDYPDHAQRGMVKISLGDHARRIL